MFLYVGPQASHSTEWSSFRVLVHWDQSTTPRRLPSGPYKLHQTCNEKNSTEKDASRPVWACSRSGRPCRAGCNVSSYFPYNECDQEVKCFHSYKGCCGAFVYSSNKKLLNLCYSFHETETALIFHLKGLGGCREWH